MDNCRQHNRQPGAASDEVARLAGYTVGMTSPELGDAFEAALQAYGARVALVPAVEAVGAVLAGAIDVLAFASPDVSAAFLAAAVDQASAGAIHAALIDRVLMACLDPQAAVPLRSAGMSVVYPDVADSTALAQEIVAHMSARHACALPVAGHVLQVRGQAALVDGVLIALSVTGMALLRELARNPGQVVTRNELLPLLLGDATEGHAVEVAIGRLRTALGDPRIVATVLKRGYRLAL